MYVHFMLSYTAEVGSLIYLTVVVTYHVIHVTGNLHLVVGFSIYSHQEHYFSVSLHSPNNHASGSIYMYMTTVLLNRLLPQAGTGGNHCIPTQQSRVHKLSQVLQHCSGCKSYQFGNHVCNWANTFRSFDISLRVLHIVMTRDCWMRP